VAIFYKNGETARLLQAVYAGVPINLPGSLPDAKRLRLHDPPAAGAVWNFQPKVVMADGATAVDAAVVKVFANKEKLDEYAPSGEKSFWHNIEGAGDMVKYYVGADIPPGAFAGYMSGVVCIDCEWNIIPSMERQRPKGGGNGKVAVITLGKPWFDEDDSPHPLEACLVHLAAYMTFPDELRAVFTSKDVRALLRCVVGEIACPECARARQEGEASGGRERRKIPSRVYRAALCSGYEACRLTDPKGRD
jgi:hypothetical protein